jgi:hypothetical protein
MHPYTRIDERNVANPMENPYIGQEWYEHGTNHRVEHGHIMRDFAEKCWWIEINSLQDLIDFMGKEGQIILSQKYDNPGIFEIEIYDTYRE